jgi:hypothetical protein
MTGGGTAGLGLIILGLSGTIAFELANQDNQPVGSLAAPAPSRQAGAANRTAPRENYIGTGLNEILSRPVFSPDRRPVDPGTRSVTGLSRLTGIVVTDSRKIAIFAAPAGGKPVVAEEGAHLNAYQVTAISNSGVTVVGPGGTTVVTPVFDPTPPPVSRRPLPALAEPAKTPPRTQKP